MAQVIINNGDSGLVTRNNLNNMFTELYASLLIPIKIPGLGSNTDFQLPANTWLESMAIVNTSGTPTIRIGTTPNGTDILPDTLINELTPITLQQYIQNASTVYITFSGTAGVVNIRMDVLYKYF